MPPPSGASTAGWFPLPLSLSLWPAPLSPTLLAGIRFSWILNLPCLLAALCEHRLFNLFFFKFKAMTDTAAYTDQVLNKYSELNSHFFFNEGLPHQINGLKCHFSLRNWISLGAVIFLRNQRLRFFTKSTHGGLGLSQVLTSFRWSWRTAPPPEIHPTDPPTWAPKIYKQRCPLQGCVKYFKNWIQP